MSLPQISQQTRENLKRQGFVNRLYENMKLHECYQPRTFAHSFMTYGIMSTSGIGYFIARRGGYHTKTLAIAFIVAPIFALLQKRQLDYYQSTANTIIHPKQLAEEFPGLFNQYNKVLSEVQEEISRQKEVLRTLESKNQD